ncbi:MAG: hypothetical protein Q8O19_04735 [Rectinemataceae bacterium]|nr:hypothetical protein [Rectinemataceae bacterium]
MVKPEQVNAGFRLPTELVEWLDSYSEFLGKEWGTKVSRTQALIRLVTLSRRQEELRMKALEEAISHGFGDIKKYNDWARGSEILADKARHERQESGAKDGEDWSMEEEIRFRESLEIQPGRDHAINVGRQMRLIETNKWFNEWLYDNSEEEEK